MIIEIIKKLFKIKNINKNHYKSDHEHNNKDCDNIIQTIPERTLIIDNTYTIDTDFINIDF